LRVAGRAPAMLPSYLSLTSCRPSVTIGQAQRMLRELLLHAHPSPDHRPSTTVLRTEA